MAGILVSGVSFGKLLAPVIKLSHDIEIKKAEIATKTYELKILKKEMKELKDKLKAINE